MIITELRGGLGNQMFQYACAKSFSIKHGMPLYIDTGFLDSNQTEMEGFTPRKYELDVFGLDDPLADNTLVASFRQTSITQKIKRAFMLPHKKVYNQHQREGACQLNVVKPPVLLQGYWQSEQYFAEYKDDIRRAFSFENPAEISAIIKEVQSVNAVSIHFRRGDYVTNPVAANVLGTLGSDYYTRAVDTIVSKVKDPVFYLFSDDGNWVKDSFKIGYKYKIIEPFGADRHWYDMLLMSKCKHHIIANSSFSWWGAWLNPDPEKVAIAPEYWFADETLNKTSTDLIPSEWIRL